VLIRRRRFDRGGRHAKREDDVISRPARQAATALRYAASLRVWLHHGDHAQPRQQVHARWRNVGGDEAVRSLARRIPDYSVYGLTVRSDRELAGLHAVASPAAPDVVVHLGGAAPWGGLANAGDGLLFRAREEDTDAPVTEASWVEGRPGVRLRYADGAEFHLRADAREVWATWPPALSVEDASTHLLGPVMGYVLRRLGVLSLHASGVVIGGRAVAFCGASGTGKSTIAAAVAAKGHAALADDLLALREVNDATLAYPASDHLRVWDDSARMLIGEGHALRPLTPTWDKRAFPLEALGYAVARAPAPLGALFLIADRTADDTAPRVEPLRAAAAFVPLVANTAATYLLTPEMRAEEFAALSRLLACTPAFRLVPHTDPARLGRLVELVLDAAGA